MKKIKEFYGMFKKDCKVSRKTIILLFYVLLMLFCFSCKLKVNETNEDSLKKEEISEVAEISKTNTENLGDVHKLVFSNNYVTLDGVELNEYDYVWHVDIAGDYDMVKNSPSEYFTGEKQSETEKIYIAHDIRYFPVIEKEKFYKTPNKDFYEWTCNFENEKYKDLRFASLPAYDENFPYEMMHTKEEAFNNPCLHILEEGTYELSGKWHGQIFVDLGKDAFNNRNKKIKFILNNFNATCDVAPVIYVKNAYECDNEWESRKEEKNDIDCKNVGAEIIIRDDTVNNLSGNNIYRMYSVALKKNKKEQKTLIKLDGAVCSDVSLTINGENKNNGECYINSNFEGLCTNLHLFVNGGKTIINSGNDGINCNEDDVSVITINDGTLRINAGLGSEGDGIDSNGYIVINGGDIVSIAKYQSDPGIDAPKGVYLNGGSLIAMGETKTVDWPDVYVNENLNQKVLFKYYDEPVSENKIITIIDNEKKEIYEYAEKDDKYIKPYKRPFRGILITNNLMTKDNDYDISYK